MDVAGLLSGIAHNRTAFHAFILRVSTYYHGTTDAVFHLPNGVDCIFHGGERSGGRNFTISVPALDISLRFRFAGHHNILQNYEGISTFFHPDFVSELMCEMTLEVDEKAACPPLHALVLNSGQHDSWSHDRHHDVPAGKLHAWFALYLSSLLHLLQTHHAAFGAAPTNMSSTKVNAYRVVWRGNTLALTESRAADLKRLDEIANRQVWAVGMPFVNVAAILQTIPNFPACCSLQGTHLGGHEFSSFFQQKHAWNNFTASSMVTNAILRQVCPLPFSTTLT